MPAIFYPPPQPTQARPRVVQPADNLASFRDQVVVAAALGDAFRFRDQVRIVQAPLASFRDTVAIHRTLQPFTDTVRILPDVRTLFGDDIQRPFGRVEDA